MSTATVILNEADESIGVPVRATCEGCGQVWRRPAGDTYADTLPEWARGHTCDPSGATLVRRTVRDLVGLDTLAGIARDVAAGIPDDKLRAALAAVLPVYVAEVMAGDAEGWEA